MVVFAGTAHTAREYSSFIPGKYVHVGLREDIIQKYWAYCDDVRTAGQEPPQCLFIFDDVMVTQSNKKWGGHENE